MAVYRNMPERYCPFCNRVSSIANFIADSRPSKRGSFLPCCRKCTESILTQVADEYGAVAGIWAVAMINNIPMVQRIWQKVEAQVESGQLFTGFLIYYSAVVEEMPEYGGVWNSDAWAGNFVAGMRPEEEVVKIHQTFTSEELQELFADWGKFVDDSGAVDYEAYEFLIDRYAQYTKDGVGLTTAMCMQFRNLCKAEWQKIKADESGDIGAIDKAQKIVNGLLSSLKLDNFAVEKSDTDRFIDRLIWRIEETEPSEEEDEQKYRDIAGYENVFNSWMRSMRNMIAGTREYPDIPEEEK